MLNKFMILITLISLLTLVSCSDESSPLDSTEGGSASALEKSGGSALSFDGINQYVEVGDDPSLDMTNAFTISAWVYLNSYTEWASIVTKGGFYSPDDGEVLQDNNYTIHQSGPGFNPLSELGHLRFTGEGGNVVESATQIPLNEWHHIAVTYDGTTINFYFDGNPDGDGFVGGPLVPNNNALRIGVDLPGGDEYWDGMIDEVKIWNEALTLSQLGVSMHGSATPVARALAGYWRFDEGGGSTARDRSRNHNHGTSINGPAWVSPGAP